MNNAHGESVFFNRKCIFYELFVYFQFNSIQNDDLEIAVDRKKKLSQGRFTT